MSKNNISWYDIKDKAEKAEIWLYEEIGMWGKSAKDFIMDFKKITNKQVDLHINSPGGSVFEGNAIYNALKTSDKTITAYIDGIAASIASVIALASDEVVMAENAMFMIHNPSGITIGEAEDMRKSADVLDKIRDTMVGIYAKKSDKSEKEIIGLLDDETWFNATEAKENGFIDVVAEEMDIAACAKFIPTMKFYGFKKIPQIENKKIEQTQGHTHIETSDLTKTITPLSKDDKLKTVPLNNNKFIKEEDDLYDLIHNKEDNNE